MSSVVLGGAGMLGHKIVQQFLKQDLPVQCTIRGTLVEPPVSNVPFFKLIRVHENVNAGDTLALHRLLADLRPRTILNCVGVIKQRDEANSAIPSIQINSLLPHLLAEWASEWNGRVIHFSTDCVFTGNKGDYLVTDPSDAEDLYGKSKYLGEVARDNALTLRTSIIGRELSHFASLVEWFLAQPGPVRGFTKAIYSGMTTETMAELVVHIVKNDLPVSGRYHAVSEKIDKCSLLAMIRDAFGLDTEIRPDDFAPCDRSMLPSGLEEVTGFRIPDWQTQIDKMAYDPSPYGEWRQSSLAHR